MTVRTYEDYVRLVEEEYFGSVVRQDKPAILACFSEDATVTIYHGDNTPRRFGAKAEPGVSQLSTFFDHLLGNYDPEFLEFTHFIDAAHDCCATHFKVRLTPKPNLSYAAAGHCILGERAGATQCARVRGEGTWHRSQ